MAGPCSVETPEQVLASCQACKDAGATILRGGAFKPRTSPYSFQGMGPEGLKLLELAKKENWSSYRIRSYGCFPIAILRQCRYASNRCS